MTKAEAIETTENMLAAIGHLETAAPGLLGVQRRRLSLAALTLTTGLVAARGAPSEGDALRVLSGAADVAGAYVSTVALGIEDGEPRERLIECHAHLGVLAHSARQARGSHHA